MTDELPDQARRYIERWDMEPHPEGGYFCRSYESDLTLSGTDLPDRFSGERRAGSSILYLLTASEPSRFHRLSADEMWHFYEGDPVTIHMLSEAGHQTEKLGSPTDSTLTPQLMIPHNTWFGAEVETGYALVGCTVWPEFRFDDYREASASELRTSFPDHGKLIDRLT